MLKSIEITNFKSLRHVKVELGPVTVLIGRSGTGKTNFVNAIAFFRDCLLRKEAAFGEWGGGSRIVSATAPQGPNLPPIKLAYTVRFDVPGYDNSFVYELVINANSKNISQLTIFHEALAHGNESIFVRAQNKWVQEPAVVPLPAAQSLALATINELPAVARAYLVLTDGIGCYDFGGNVLQGTGREPVQHIGLRRDASNYLQCFEAINRNLQDLKAQGEIVAALRKLKPTLQGIHVDSIQRDHVVVSLQDDGMSRGFNLSQESEGFRRFLAHLIAIYQVPPKQLLAFEEPEKGLYPGALYALAEQFRACPAAGRGQVVLTTHNPLLLDQFEPEEIRVVEIEDLETKIGMVSQPQIDALKEHLLTTGELLTVDPARLALSADEP